MSSPDISNTGGVNHGAEQRAARIREDGISTLFKGYGDLAKKHGKLPPFRRGFSTLRKPSELELTPDQLPQILKGRNITALTIRHYPEDMWGGGTEYPMVTLNYDESVGNSTLATTITIEQIDAAGTIETHMSHKIKGDRVEDTSGLSQTRKAEIIEAITKGEMDINDLLQQEGPEAAFANMLQATWMDFQQEVHTQLDDDRLNLFKNALPDIEKELEKNN